MSESLKALRTRLGWSQADVAAACNLTQPIVSLAERGKSAAGTIDRIRAALEAESRRQAAAAEEAAAVEQMETARREEAAREAQAAAKMEALAAAMPDSPEWQALRAAMKERALDHLDRGEPAACDALLEMIPAAETRALLDGYFDPPAAREVPPDSDKPQNTGANTPAAPAAEKEPAPSEAAMTETLADRIDGFLEKHARIRRSYVPGEDDPEERFNGPDTAMLASAAAIIRRGERPHLVHSDWISSGCYQVPADPEAARAAQAEHDALNAEINQLARETGRG